MSTPSVLEVPILAGLDYHSVTFVLNHLPDGTISISINRPRRTDELSPNPAKAELQKILMLKKLSGTKYFSGKHEPTTVARLLPWIRNRVKEIQQTEEKFEFKDPIEAVAKKLMIIVPSGK